MKITYENKVAIQNDEEILRKNKVTDLDMNEIKEVVNSNADEQTTIKSDITNIKQKDTEQDNKLLTLQTENTKLKEENERLREDLKGLPSGIVSGESIDLKDSSEMRVLNFEIGGNSRQETRSGINFIDTSKASIKTSNGMTFDINKDTTLKFNGKTTALTNFWILNLEEMLPAGAYYFSTNLSLVNKGIYQLKYSDQTSYTTNGNSSFTLEEDKKLDSILIQINSEITFTEQDFYLQLVQGTEEKTFEPYGVSPSPDYPSEVECCGDNVNIDICNKNLFDISDKVAYHSGNTLIEEINDGIRIYYIGSNISTYTVFRTYKIKKILKSDIGKTIKLKMEISTSNLNTGQYNIGYCDENFSLRTSVEASKNSGRIISMNINEEMVGKYIAIWFYANSGGGTIVQNDYVDFTKIQLEYDNISDYMLNKAQMYTIPTQQPMRAIGEYKDTFIKKDGKWYERHFVKRLILEGTEAKWALYTTGTRRYGLDLSADLPLKIINKYGIGYSSHFEIKNIISSDLIMFLQVELNHFYVGITDINTKWNSTNDLKGWLSEQNNAGAPVYVDYVLETPIEVECTAEQTEILEKIGNEAKTYKNVTHIYSTDEINPNMKVTYFKDIETIIGG